MADIERRWPARVVEVSGQRWGIRDTGGGHTPPLVLLPGALGTGDVFQHLLTDLGSRHRLIAVTFPAVADARALAQGVTGLLDALDLQTVDLLGTSLGGYVAQWVGVRDPQRLRRLILANTFHDPGLQQARWPAAEVYARQSEAEVLAAARQTLEKGEPATPAHVALKRLMLELVGPHQDAANVKAMRLAVLTAPVVEKVDLPDQAVALIDSDDDAVIAAPTREQMRQRYAASAQMRIDGGGHFPANLRPQAYATAVARLIDA